MSINNELEYDPRTDKLRMSPTHVNELGNMSMSPIKSTRNVDIPDLKALKSLNVST